MKNLHKALSAITVFVLLMSTAGYAKTPEQIRSQADNDVQIASGLLAEAQKLLHGNVSQTQVTTAMNLFMRAGQLYEQAANTYRSLGPNYATREDVENSMAATKQCVDAIQNLRKQMR